MSSGLPSGAVGLSVFVLVYSATCLFLGLLLAVLLWRQNSRLTYVFFIAIYGCLATLCSIIQQIHYAISFREIRMRQAEARLDTTRKPGAALGGEAVGMDLVLFWMQYYSYNVNALMILFWSIQLFQNTWRIKSNSVWLTDKAIENSLKAFAIIFPGLLFGIIQIPAVAHQFIVYLVFCNVILFVSLLGGSTFLALTLFKFIQTRRRVNASSSDPASSGNSHSATVTTGTENRHLSAKRSSDRWLVIRFTIAFVILSIFELCVILFEVVSVKRNHKAKEKTGIDISVEGAIIELAQFMPGVTQSLVAFLVWGTTAGFRHDMAVIFCCGVKKLRSSHGPHARGSSIGAKFRPKTSSSEEGIFQRLEEGNDEIEQRQMKVSNIQVTTELSVLREENRAEIRPPHELEGESWRNKEPIFMAAGVTSSPQRSGSTRSVRRSRSLSRF